MAFDEYLVDRMKTLFSQKGIRYEAKRMMGGICFMVDDKMCCGTHFDKKRSMNLIMARIGEDAYEEALKKNGCQPMDFTGRPMRGFVFITPEGFDSEEELEYWVQLCIDFNPIAKRSKKRKSQ